MNKCPSSLPKLHIIGAGSIGLLFASSIRTARPNFPVRLLLRSRHRQNLNAYDEIIKAVPRSDHLRNLDSFGSHNIKCRLSSLMAKNCANILSKGDLKIVVTNPCQILKNAHTDFIDDATHYILATLYSKQLRQTSIIDIPSELILEENILHVNGKPCLEKDDWIQNIVLATKAPDAANALKSVVHRLDPRGSNIIVLTNGALAVVEELQEVLNNMNDLNSDSQYNKKVNAKIIMASTTHGSHCGSNEDYVFDRRAGVYKCYHVEHAGVGNVYLESDEEIADRNNHGLLHEDAISTLLTDAGLQPKYLPRDEMYVMHWKKLAANCVINPLTALRRCTNGELTYRTDKKKLFKNKYLSYNNPNIMKDLIYEISKVAMAESKRRSTKTIDNEENFSEKEITKFIESVIANTANNKSSMLQDIIAKRHPTEVKYLNGYVVRLGVYKYGLSMKANNYLIKEIERLSGSF